MSLYCITTCLTLFDQGKLMTAINVKVNNNASREVFFIAESDLTYTDGG